MLNVKNASFSYDGKIACSNLNFQVEEGDYLCVVGENGAGKSTLIKGLLGLKAPTSGEVNCKLPNGKIGYMPQQTAASKDFPASSFEVVLSGCSNNLFATKADKQKAKQNMEKLAVYNLKDECFRELSGGQQQRVLLARALCSCEDLLVLDEPTAGLDPLATNDMYRLIAELNANKVTIIMVSHDINAAVKYAKNILHLNGEQLFFGNVDDYKNSDIGKKFLLW